MKKTIQTMALSSLIATSGLFGGGNIAPVVPIEEIDPNPFYVGAGLVWAGVSRDCFCPPDETTRLKDSTWGGIIRAGYDYNQYVGIEVRALQSSIESDWVDKTTHYGIFVKPMMPIDEQMNIYGLLGYGHTEVETDCPFLKDTFTHDGFSYGIGLEYDLSDRDSDKEEGAYDRPIDRHGEQEKGWGLFIDYQNLMHNEGPDNIKTNIISFGITYDF